MNDKCPNSAEDRDYFQDKDGCPDFDNDFDNIPDSVDNCPKDAEDSKDPAERDGCPEMDRDHDGIVDSLDKCPDKAEKFNGFLDLDGCPDRKPKKDFKALARGIQFKSGTARFEKLFQKYFG